VTFVVNPVNDPPIADAGPDQTVTVGDLVALDGTGSSDPDTDVLNFFWEIKERPDGSIAELIDSTTASPTLTPDLPGDYTIALTVDDGNGETAGDRVIITAQPQPNRPPTAVDDAYTTDEDTPLSVDAPGVLENDTDPDGDTLTAALVDNPTNGTITLNPDGSFTYTPTPDYFGPDTFTYQANDATTESNTATVTLTINPINDPPTADAGPDQTVTVGDLVTLDGSGSSDPVEGDPLGYQWAFVAVPTGSVATLTGSATVSPTFTPDLSGDYVVELSVDDGNGGTDTDAATVTTGRIGMTISLTDSLVGVGRTIDGRSRSTTGHRPVAST
jgi:hypothetical protein